MSSPGDGRARLTDEEAYTSLLEICTELIIAEDTDDTPLRQPLRVLHDLLHCEDLSGDATVLSVRAVRILLERFISPPPRKLRVKLVECVQAALGRVGRMMSDLPRRDIDLRFVHTRRWELQEELLQCMSAAARSAKVIQAALPPLQEQLSFCLSVMDVSLDMCLQALRMCCVLLRSCKLSSQPNLIAQIRDLSRSRLVALESMEMNQDWLRLLRHLTEVAVTLKAYAERPLDTSEANTTAREKKHRKRKRSTAPNPQRMVPVSAAGVDGERREGIDEALILLRLCQRVCATPRLDHAFRSTVFSCANAVLSHGSYVAGIAADICITVAMDLARELNRNVRTTLTIGNPFVNRDGVSGSNSGASTTPVVDADEEREEDLLNNGEDAKWYLPEPEWPLLILIARLFAAKTVPAAKHMWWTVGSDGYMSRFSKEDRTRLTNAFFAGQDVLDFTKRKTRVYISSMREFVYPFDLGWGVFFQPIPCAFALTAAVPVAPSLQCSLTRAGELALALRKCNVPALLEHLQVACHNDGSVGVYAQSVLLQVLLIAGPHAKDAARAALRSFLADATTSLVEEVSDVLVRHDKAWAGTLLEVGVAETILRRSVSATAVRSPVLQMLRREAASLPSTPPLLPHSELSTVRPLELRRVLKGGDRSGVQGLLETLTFTEACAWDTEACRQIVLDLADAAQTSGAAPARWARQLEQHLTGFVVKRLQDLAFHLQQSRTLKQIVEEEGVVEIIVCDRGRSGRFTCPSQHSLHHHHSRNWKCDECSASGLEDAWSCRMCDYDICASCSKTHCNRVSGALTATVQDLLKDWRGSVDRSAEGHASLENVFFFTEERGLISTATPLAGLHGQTAHLGEVYTACPCGLVSPGSAMAPDVAGATHSSLLGALISTFGRTCGQDVGVQRCLLKAYESAGVFVFLGGARAIPEELRCLTKHLAPYLPLSVKHLITRYVAMGCRRYAFQILHDQEATVMSRNTGVAPESSKLDKVDVPRSDKPGLLRVLYDTFCSLPSPLVTLDFTFEGEEGFGSGPSQEVYTELSAYFRAEPKFWFVTEDDGGADPVTLSFPTTKALFLKEFFVLGAACARSFIDEYRMDMDLLPQAWPLLMLPSVGLSLHQNAERHTPLHAMTVPALTNLLEVLDPLLHRSFVQLRSFSETELAAAGLEMDDGTPLKSHADLEQHIQHTVVTRFEVALENLRHFQLGLLSVMEVEALWCLSDEERSALLCGSDAVGDSLLFTEEELQAQTTPGNGYCGGSTHVKMFVSIVGSEFTRAQQRDFLEFLTGSPRLPFNGLAGLGRCITVAMKDMESKKEQTLPSCNTCFLYLKLPPYTTREIMKERLLFAVTEGRRNYSLS
ncbi:hypothetical protein JKF63_01963 [Porcisia hertigi]|uniref:HECT domain-containing protein n=1 Tax=Porcisia hertigi TaxID=2761500 RepID=A0A836IGR0_9TRYP|nr:hypothetical protein JKF63_01963 [Porcisia hertigi]